ncbi:hypothetical protein KCU70_g436, partial [Aureobasidium melanogenum]
MHTQIYAREALWMRLARCVSRVGIATSGPTRCADGRWLASGGVAKSRWDRGWWIMMGDDHGLDGNPRVGRGLRLLERVRASLLSRREGRQFSRPRHGFSKRNNDFSVCGTAARARGRVIILVNFLVRLSLFLGADCRQVEEEVGAVVVV